MSIISVSVGTALAAGHGSIDWWAYALSILGVVFLHAGTNVLNDYFDYKNKVDTPDVPGSFSNESRVLIQKMLTHKQVLALGLGLFVLSLPIGIYLTLAKGFTVLIVGLLGFLAGFFYTANPISFKYLALGEPMVFLMWGPLMVSGAYFVQQGEITSQAILVSIPFGILVALILLANNIRDIQYDSKVGIKTMPILLGHQKAVWLYQVLVFLAYLGLVVLCIIQELSWWGLLVFISVPLAMKLIRAIKDEAPPDADARTAQLDTLFGVLLIIALIISNYQR